MPFINEYNWSEIDFPSHQKDCEKIEANNEPIALNILHIPYNIKDSKHSYKSKFNLTREHQVILLMVRDNEKWHYLAVKNLNALLKGIILGYGGNFDIA